MDKLTMAHDFVTGCIKNPTVTLRAEDIKNIIHNAWQYADAMQAEADKRQNNTTVASHVESSEYYPHYEAGRDYPPDCYVMYNGKKTLAVSISNEWQPDWSQAPSWANWWATDKDLDSFWHENKPNFDEIEFYQCGMFCDAPSFNYQGNWQESLRKRPQ